jgi:L-lactate dehydrogenase complex protein LldG
LEGSPMSTLFETFKARAEAVSAEVHRFATRREAFAFILGLLQEQGVRDGQGPGALWADGSFLKGFGKAEINREAPGIGFEITRQAAAQARVGISQVGWAVAATGTLVVDAAQVEQRLVSTLPPIHVALVASSSLRADLAEVLTQIHPSQTGYISMITGPSRTADIERVLTIGVHGPERLVIVFVDELERGKA